MVAAARAAHHRIGASAHAPLGAAGHPGHHAAEQVVPHTAGLDLALQGAGDADAGVVLQAEVRQALVHLHALQHEGQLLPGALLHDALDLRHGHGLQALMNPVLTGGGPGLLQKDLVIPLGEDDVGVGPPNLADADSGGGDDLRPGVELGLAPLDQHAYMPVLHHLDGLGGDILVDVLQQLQALLRVAELSAQGGGVFQAHPGKAGDAHAHAVFVDAGVDLQLHGDHLAAHGVRGVCGGQGHADRLRAAQCRDHLLVQQGDQFFLCNHVRAPLCPIGWGLNNCKRMEQLSCHPVFHRILTKPLAKKRLLWLTG